MDAKKIKPSEMFRKNIARILETYPHGIQTTICNKMNIPDSDLSGYLKGGRNWSEEKCMELANIVGTTYMDILLIPDTSANNRVSKLECKINVLSEDIKDLKSAVHGTQVKKTAKRT
ncbi:hypothetical protein LCGC14_1253740 [marine sediment metagenome]|uniref:HTH cro/C1-type domain-containing protein n=1 Tax=marine sediment metagenome TaxID=412755 RepID=A0A0F9L2K6_9ZZZZ